MTWWRRLWQRITGRGPRATPDEITPQSQTTPFGPPATPPSGPSPDPRRESEPTGAEEPRAARQRPLRIGMEVDSDEAASIVEPPPPAGPARVAPPSPARAVRVEVTPLPADHVARTPEAQHVPQVRARPEVDIDDRPFDLPDFSSISYPEVPGGFVGPSRDAGAPPRVDVGSSPYTVPATSELLGELSATEVVVGLSLRHEPITISLPSAGSAPGAYALPRLPEEFVDPATGQARTLRQAVPSLDGAGGDSPDALDRLELVRLVARLLDGLHARDYFTSGLDLDMIAYCLDPRPTIALVAGDRVRRVGGAFLASAPATGDTPSMDRDREGFALLARRLLGIAGHFEDADVIGLDEVQVRGAHRLWSRATGPEGTRPQVREWLAVLG